MLKGLILRMSKNGMQVLYRVFQECILFILSFFSRIEEVRVDDVRKVADRRVSTWLGSWRTMT